MAFHYAADAVYWSYHHDKPSDYAPTADDLVGWDQALFESYEADLNDLMAEFGITNTKGVKSTILQLAIISNGPSTRWKVRNACKYYQNVAR